jgi:N-acetylmuramoyl-L-alanine amidase
LSVLLFALPAAAGRLLFWRFESNYNRLVFTTDARVQPRAQLIFNPSRIVIDLPGIVLGRPSVSQAVGGTIRSVRVGQFDSQTARIVIELVPGYTVDPQQVKIRGISPTQWTVELPPPTRETSQPAPTPPEPSPSPSGPSSSLPPSQPANSSDFQVTRNGLFVALARNGDQRQIQAKRSRDLRSIEFTLPGAILTDSLRSQNLSVNNYKVGEIQFEQVSISPPTARLVMQVSQDSPEWQATYSRLGGIILLPRGGLERLAGSSPLPGSPSLNPSSPLSGKATITSVELANNDSQLLIRADRSVNGEGKWNRLSGYYEIRITNAQLANSLRGPQLRRDSPIYQLRIRQEDAQTVAILLRPSLGTQFGNLQQVGDGLLALDVRSGNTRNPSIAATVQGVPIQVPPPPNGNYLPPPQTYPTPELPSAPRGRLLVVIDPGHGGKDPGAIGISGIQEKDIILPISQEVGRILEGQGIQVMLTRTADYFVSLQGRTDMSNRARADLFVSIHANSMGQGRPDVSGLEVYYFGDRRLADTIYRSITRSINIQQRGVRRARFYVLRTSNMPSTLVEVGFVTGYEDAAKLTDPGYRRQMAAAIARGILEYLQQNRL